jgi:hypothetical protein
MNIAASLCRYLPIPEAARRLARFLPNLLIALSCLTQGIAHGAVATDGKALFTGQTPIAARLVGHAETLPVQASRCSNCHAVNPPRSPIAASFAPVLDAPSLLSPISRRGGPPSKFDSASLCKLLRDGIDPAWIVLPATMPRYTVSDDQCLALWSFLVKPK